MISVLVVDDDDVVRAGLRALLGNEDGFTFAGEARDGLDAVALAKQQRPDIVLMDVRMPGIDGLEATRRLLADPELQRTRVVMLTAFEDEQYVLDALRYGACGFLLKDTAPTELLRAIRHIADGGALLSPTATRTVARAFATRSARSPKPHPNLHRLTQREREVIRLVGQGLDNHEIARRLVVSPATSRTHVSRVMIKLDARDRAQLVAFAYQSGLTA